MAKRMRSQSIDVGVLKPRLYDGVNLSKASGQSDLGAVGRRQSVATGVRYGTGRQSVDGGTGLGRRQSVEVGALRGRRQSRTSVDGGPRRHLSYDAWIRAIRVSHAVYNTQGLPL